MDENSNSTDMDARIMYICDRVRILVVASPIRYNNVVQRNKRDFKKKLSVTVDIKVHLKRKLLVENDNRKRRRTEMLFSVSFKSWRDI